MMYEVERYQQMELPMFQGLPFSSHGSGGALRASACHAVVCSMLLEEVHGTSEAFNVWQITLCQPGHYSRNGGCGVWSVLLRMLKIDLIHCQAAWCLSQKLPGTADSSTESCRRFCRSMLRFRVPRRTANAPWFPNDPYWLNHTYTFGVRIFLTDWTWMEIKCTYTKSCSLRFSIISMYLRIVLVRRARLLRRIDASNTYL